MKGDANAMNELDVVKIGDWCMLYRGDCLEVLPTFEPGSIVGRDDARSMVP